MSQTEAGLIRLTLDEDLRAVRVGQPEYVAVEHATPLLKDQAILELKFRLGMPAAIQADAGAIPVDGAAGFRKYRLAVEALGCAPVGVALNLTAASEAACV